MKYDEGTNKAKQLVNQPTDNHTGDTLAALTLAEKVHLCHAATLFSVCGIARLGIPDMVMSDGPHGVREELADDDWAPRGDVDDSCSYLPTGTALAATWNSDMAKRHGMVLGAEARERGKDVILGPGINIIRTPLCGRNFEYYSEDPYLVAVLVGEEVRGIQSQGVAACAKHFACNSQELNRFAVDALPSERALREIYLPGFKAAVDAGLLTIMGAYNRLRGQWCCQNDYLLNQVLKTEWGFAGLVVSDWGGVHNNCFEPALYGLDIEMGTHRPFDEYFLAGDFLKALENGEIDEAVVDDTCRRYLFVMERIGAMGDGAAARPAGERNTAHHQAECRAIADEAMVLLKNDGLLPLDKTGISSLLVIGSNAMCRHAGGGGSAGVKPHYEITPLEGLQQYLSDAVRVEYCPDPMPADGSPIPNHLLSTADQSSGVKGWVRKRYDRHDVGGEVVEETAVTEVDLDWNEKLPDGVADAHEWSLRYVTTLTPEKSGTYTFVLRGNRDAGLNVNGSILLKRRDEDGAPDTACSKIELIAGKPYELVVRVAPNETGSSKHVKLTWLTPDDATATSLAELREKARQADVVIYVGGLSHLEEIEGRDRKTYRLPGLQDEVIAALADANPNLVIMMTGGSPYAMPWVDQVPAILHMGYAGMEAGAVAARILFGEVNPSGKLPFTFPIKLEDSSAHCLDDYQRDVCYYKEDIFVGYRWFDQRDIAPLFCFGHGLSYTSFDYRDLEIATDGEGIATISCRVTNTGLMTGAEVVQLYLHDCECSVRRPPQELKGFRKVYLDPGESTSVTFILRESDLAFFHPTRREWVAEEGDFEVRVNASSRDNRLTGVFSFSRPSGESRPL
ncbi:MAG: glycoside hydrolase family 3 C-terminal domain-containing protein [Lentisphaeria bacterium]|nr:glycoside hydrolase family 3 C-terminal domain-containing protein [Lentisphaeria bacterium]